MPDSRQTHKMSARERVNSSRYAVERQQVRPRVTDAQRLAKRGLRVGRTSVGKGVFATKLILDGSCVGEIEGEVIVDSEYVSRYCFDMEDGTQLEPAQPFRFVNHSCEPNCAFQAFSFPKPAEGGNPLTLQPVIVPSSRKLLLFAICDIGAGEELTIDYSWPADFAIPCRCRSVDCRGWIVDLREVDQLRELLGA